MYAILYPKRGMKVRKNAACGQALIHAYEVFEHLHMLWKGVWVHRYTVILVQRGVQSLENWGQAELKRHCGDFVEAVKLPTLRHTSIINVYDVFETSAPENYSNTASCCVTPSTKKSGPKQEQMNLAG